MSGKRQLRTIKSSIIPSNQIKASLNNLTLQHEDILDGIDKLRLASNLDITGNSPTNLLGLKAVSKQSLNKVLKLSPTKIKSSKKFKSTHKSLKSQKKSNISVPVTISDLKTTPNKENLFYLFEEIVENTKNFISEKEFKKEVTKNKIKSITMLMDDLWTEKYRKTMVRFYENHEINLENDSVTFILLGGRKSQKRIEEARKRKKLKEKLERRANRSQSSSSKSKYLRSSRMSESFKQKNVGRFENFNDLEIKRVFSNLKTTFLFNQILTLSEPESKVLLDHFNSIQNEDGLHMPTNQTSSIGNKFNLESNNLGKINEVEPSRSKKHKPVVVHHGRQKSSIPASSKPMFPKIKSEIISGKHRRVHTAHSQNIFNNPHQSILSARNNRSIMSGNYSSQFSSRNMNTLASERIITPRVMNDYIERSIFFKQIDPIELRYLNKKHGGSRLSHLYDLEEIDKFKGVSQVKDEKLKMKQLLKKCYYDTSKKLPNLSIRHRRSYSTAKLEARKKKNKIPPMKQKRDPEVNEVKKLIKNILHDKRERDKGNYNFS